MIFRVLVVSLLLLVIEFYTFQAVRLMVKSNWFLTFYQIISAFLFVYIFYFFATYDRTVGQTQYSLFVFGLLLLVYLPKMVVTLILLGEDVFRFLFGVFNYFAKPNTTQDFLFSRRRFVTQVALGLSAVPFLSLIYGMAIGKYNYKVIKQTLFFDDLPQAFDNFTITQISDVHSGSFDNPEKINYAIDLINQQNSDMILFTGDIVNTHAKEMDPWIETFNKIQPHAYGKYSVLGNHDYGEYVTWDSEIDKQANFEAIKKLYQQIDFKLLLNQHTFITKGADKIALVGVENWGHNFKQAGDINKASTNLGPTDFKILMSHDPSHWEYEIKNHDTFFHLTLSGHTHGMQFGIEIPGWFKWSLSQYVYKQWAGLYEHLGRYIYVNRGFGFHAYPGRVGIMPEITVIKLKKSITDNKVS